MTHDSVAMRKSRSSPSVWIHMSDCSTAPPSPTVFVRVSAHAKADAGASASTSIARLPSARTSPGATMAATRCTTSSCNTFAAPNVRGGRGMFPPTGTRSPYQRDVRQSSGVLG